MRREMKQNVIFVDNVEWVCRPGLMAGCSVLHDLDIVQHAC